MKNSKAEFSQAEIKLVGKGIQNVYQKHFAKNDSSWESPALNVIACVLSLNKNWDRVVLKRIMEFRRRHHPAVSSLRELKLKIKECGGPTRFLKLEMDLNDPQRAKVLLGVLNFVEKAQTQVIGKTEKSRLKKWAKTVMPHDFKKAKIKGFGIAGWQFLRILFGANTVKPDVHINAFVLKYIGRKVSPSEALRCLEISAKAYSIPLRDLDSSIWASQKKAMAKN